MGPIANTFSIVAIDRESECIGAAAASCVLAVGASVTHIRADVGAVNTQSLFDPRMAKVMLAEMSSGAGPEEALRNQLKADADRQMRQILAINLSNEKFVWSGEECLKPYCHKEGKDCIAAGNRLASASVVAAMVTAFDDSEGKALAERLLLAMEAGYQEGGDALGHESAVLQVVPKRANEVWPVNWVDLRVDYDRDPIHKLRELYAVFETRNKGYTNS